MILRYSWNDLMTSNLPHVEKQWCRSSEVDELEKKNPPLWKDCPECDGSGTRTRVTGKNTEENIPCIGCPGTGQVPNYLTPEQWEEKTGKKLLDSDRVWVFADAYQDWEPDSYFIAKLYTAITVVHVNGQPAPPKEYRP